MGEKKQNAYMKNAPLLFFLFIVLSLVLMIRLLTESATVGRVEVETRFTDVVADYAAELRDVLIDMRDQGDVVGAVAGNMDADDDAGVRAALSSVAGIRDNYLAVLCDPTGRAIYKISGDQGIYSGDLSYVSYASDVVRTGRGYLYVENDEIVGKTAIVCISGVETDGENSGYFLQYYDVSEFKDIAKRTEFGTGSQIWVIDGSGKVLAYTGLYDNYLNEGHNFWEELESQGTTSEKLAELKQNVRDRNTSVNYVEQRNGAHVYVCARVGISDWNVVVEITNSYMEKQVERENSVANDIALQMIVLTVLFGCVVVAIGIVSVKSEKESKANLEVKADTDLLTDLYNKLATERKIKEYISTHPNQQGLLFVLDIDNFKKINDTMGHAFGDEVLRAVGIMIKTEFRASDIIGRTGGDEFTIFLKNVREEEEIKKQVERILRFFSNLQVGEYVKYSPNASIGAAVFPRDAADFEGLYKAADSALYVAKKRGKNQLAFYGEDK